MTPFNPMMMRHGFHPMMTGMPTNGEDMPTRILQRRPMQTGGSFPGQPMPGMSMGGNAPSYPMQPPMMGDNLPPQSMPQMQMGGNLPPQGGYDSSGINPGGMYTGGNMHPMAGGRQYGPHGFNMFGRPPIPHMGNR